MNEKDEVSLYHLGVTIILRLNSIDFKRGELYILTNRELSNKFHLEEKLNNLKSWSEFFYDNYTKEIII